MEPSSFTLSSCGRDIPFPGAEYQFTCLLGLAWKMLKPFRRANHGYPPPDIFFVSRHHLLAVSLGSISIFG